MLMFMLCYIMLCYCVINSTTLLFMINKYKWFSKFTKLQEPLRECNLRTFKLMSTKIKNFMITLSHFYWHTCYLLNKTRNCMRMGNSKVIACSPKLCQKLFHRNATSVCAFSSNFTCKNIQICLVWVCLCVVAMGT